MTSNRDAVDWLATFADTLLAQTTIDVFQNAAYALDIGGESIRPGLNATLGKAGPTPDRSAEKKPVNPRVGRQR